MTNLDVDKFEFDCRVPNATGIISTEWILNKLFKHRSIPMKRLIQIIDINDTVLKEFNLSIATGIKLRKMFIYFDELEDKTSRLQWNPINIPEFSKIDEIEIVHMKPILKNRIQDSHLKIIDTTYTIQSIVNFESPNSTIMIEEHPASKQLKILISSDITKNVYDIKKIKIIRED